MFINAEEGGESEKEGEEGGGLQKRRGERGPPARFFLFYAGKSGTNIIS